MLMKITCVTGTNDKSKCTLVLITQEPDQMHHLKPTRRLWCKQCFQIPTRILNGHLEFFTSFIIKWHLMWKLRLELKKPRVCFQMYIASTWIEVVQCLQNLAYMYTSWGQRTGILAYMYTSWEQRTGVQVVSGSLECLPELHQAGRVHVVSGVNSSPQVVTVGGPQLQVFLCLWETPLQTFLKGGLGGEVEEGGRRKKREEEEEEGGGGGGRRRRRGSVNLKLTYLYNDCFLIISQAYHTFIFVRSDCINTPS